MAAVPMSVAVGMSVSIGVSIAVGVAVTVSVAVGRFSETERGKALMGTPVAPARLTLSLQQDRQVDM